MPVVGRVQRRHQIRLSSSSSPPHALAQLEGVAQRVDEFRDGDGHGVGVVGAGHARVEMLRDEGAEKVLDVKVMHVSVG